MEIEISLYLRLLRRSNALSISCICCTVVPLLRLRRSAIYWLAWLIVSSCFLIDLSLFDLIILGSLQQMKCSESRMKPMKITVKTSCIAKATYSGVPQILRMSSILSPINTQIISSKKASKLNLIRACLYSRKLKNLFKMPKHPRSRCSREQLRMASP